jgi:UDP-GlcNAc:undecaprenyl-phosphate GlcNAc-1-phosphate transferase
MSFAGIVLLVALMSFASIFLLTPVAEKFGLVDEPNDVRKFHRGRIPLIGGISTYIGLVMGLAMFVTPDVSLFTYLVCSSLLVFLGVADDAKDISPKIRLVVQSVVAVIMCVGGDLYIKNLGDLLGLGGNIDLGMFGYVVTIAAVIAAINAFNMIDGIDGLLGISSLVTFFGMGLLFYLNADISNMTLALIISVALMPYLAVNLGVPPVKLKKIFMGDTGSMLIGFTVVWLLIQGSQHVGESGKPSFSAATALWLIAFPLMDMVRVMLDRLSRGKSPLEADRTHLHHILLSRNPDKYAALLKICGASAFFAMVGVALERTGKSDSFAFFLFIATFALYAVIVNKIQKKNES